MTSDRIILGIDPGTVIMGYGFIHQKGNKIELITMGVLKLSKVEGHHNKLKRIFEGTNSLIEQYKPDELAIEAPFYGKDVQAMLKLGRAQGVAIAAALSKSIPIFEYAPRKIKKAVTGNGNASKEQVAAMLESLVVFHEKPKYLDATDGLAAAVCHWLQKKSQTDGKNYSGWKSFIKDNPGRIT